MKDEPKWPYLPHLPPCGCSVHMDIPQHFWAAGANSPVWVDRETGEIVRDFIGGEEWHGRRANRTR